MKELTWEEIVKIAESYDVLPSTNITPKMQTELETVSWMLIKAIERHVELWTSTQNMLRRMRRIIDDLL